MKKIFRNSILVLLFTLIVVIVAGYGCKESDATKKEAHNPVELSLSPDYLKSIERSSIELQGKKDTGTRKYEGIALWRLLDKAGISSGKLKHKEIGKRYLVARGADGFEVVFSLAELDTAFSNKEVILADKVKGKELPTDREPYQLIVQDDRRPTRNCYQIVKLIVYEANSKNN